MLSGGGCHHAVDLIASDDVPMLRNCMGYISLASLHASLLVRVHRLSPCLNCSKEGLDVHTCLRFCSGLVLAGVDAHVRFGFRSGGLVRVGFDLHAGLRFCSGLARE